MVYCHERNIAAIRRWVGRDRAPYRCYVDVLGESYVTNNLGECMEMGEQSREAD